MLLEKFIEQDLGHVSYIIADEYTKEAMIIDPKRDISAYKRFLSQEKLDLKFIFNTHTHADYIGGHLELIDSFPKAKNIFYKNVPAKFNFYPVDDGSILKLGKITLHVLYTPGHTPFCISCIINEENIEKYIFTGDILFVGDIARPDLLGKKLLDDLVQDSYNTAKRLWNLNDEIIIFTSHIKGSFCGKDLKNQYFSTIGIEKKTNKSFSLLAKSKEAYIDNLKSQKIETPSFFKEMASINIEGPSLLKNLTPIKRLTEDDFFSYVKGDDYIIDFREPELFQKGFIKNSINIYEKSNITLIAGSLIHIKSKLFLVGNKQTNFQEIIKRLQSIGFDNIAGILDKNVEDLKELETLKQNYLNDIKVINLDTTSNIGDINIEISQIKEIDLEKDHTYKIVCKNGYKSIAVESFLNRSK